METVQEKTEPQARSVALVAVIFRQNGKLPEFSNEEFLSLHRKIVKSDNTIIRTIKSDDISISEIEPEIPAEYINEIHRFANYYYGLYSNSDTAEINVIEGFAEKCFGFGFEMDCGKKFIETYSQDAFNNVDSFKGIINNVHNINLLGSAIFSQWRYVTHWSYGESLLEEKWREWFKSAFKQLTRITDERICKSELKV